jgi:lipid-A-disaccharide synthase
MSFVDLDLFVVAAELSADKHGKEIIQKLLSFNPKLKIAGILGPNLRSLNLECFFPMEKLQVMGFTDVLFALPKILYRFFQLKKKLLRIKPKAILFIDYPEFNLRLEKTLKANRFKGKIFHHISPTVWAWAKKRTLLMEKGIDELFCIFPFEKAFFAKASFNVEYVGHPIFELIQNYQYDLNFHEKYQLKNKGPLLAIFPGSREKEIKRNLEIQLKAAKNLQQQNENLTILLSISDQHLQKSIEKIVVKIKLKVVYVLADDTYNLMKFCDMAIATSGTITLELAFHKVPTVVTFAIKLIDLIIAQKILKIDLPFYCIVNIIVQKPIFAELYGPNLTLNKLFYWSNRLLNDLEYRNDLISKCQEIIYLFENKSPNLQISKKILSFLNKDL